ncbi:MAG: A/G-specific adenine glycosylase [Pseudomonadota bacterium]
MAGRRSECETQSARENAAELRARLLDWYDRQGRTLPWRIRPEDRASGTMADPYAVWLSEIMLQQTTVAHAAPYWLEFLKRWPGVRDLAAADREDVLAAWAGLGYYARARNLHACAGAVCERHDGVFPNTLDELRALPGIGEYTANAIRAVAFDRPASVVDGNVERVLSRLFSLETPLPKAKPEIRTLAGELADPARPGDYAQALMDLGATVCTPKSPQCEACPWTAACSARAASRQTEYPKKLKKKPKPVRRGVCFHVVGQAEGGASGLWLRTRPDEGLLGGMLELPGPAWSAESADWRASAPFHADWHEANPVSHVFTHFQLELRVMCADAPEDWRPPEGRFVTLEMLGEVALPSVMMKAARAGLNQA